MLIALAIDVLAMFTISLLCLNITRHAIVINRDGACTVFLDFLLHEIAHTAEYRAPQSLLAVLLFILFVMFDRPTSFSTFDNHSLLLKFRLSDEANSSFS